MLFFFQRNSSIRFVGYLGGNLLAGTASKRGTPLDVYRD